MSLYFEGNEVVKTENVGITELEVTAVPVRRTKKPMAAASLKKWLKQYKVSSRASTITNAFMAALAHFEPYDERCATKALKALGQNDLEALTCVYCSEPASTWDHVVNLVVGKKLNGFGHQLGNLVPCCGGCNSNKSDKEFKAFVETLNLSPKDKEDLCKRLEAHQKNYAKEQTYSAEEEKLASELSDLMEQVGNLLKKADELVAKARPKSALKRGRPALQKAEQLEKTVKK